MIGEVSDLTPSLCENLVNLLTSSRVGFHAVLMIFALLKIIRPMIIPEDAADEQRSRALEMIRANGSNPLIRFTLFDDKSYFFSTGGSIIAYVLVGKTAIALGDPVGTDADLSHCLHEFKDFCARNHWLASFFQVLPDHLDKYKKAGFDYICIGHDAIIDLSSFTLAGSERKNIRNSFHKMLRLGYKVQVCNPPHPSTLIQELNQVSDKWLALHGGSEVGFSVGRLEENYLNTSSIILVRGMDGCAEAFINVLLGTQPNEAVIDLMRYRPGSQNGLMDYLFVSALQWAKDSGLSFFNLGFSPFTGVGPRPQAPAVERMLGFLHKRLVHFHDFRGLEFFKEKFMPAWSPRYLVYPGLLSLPAVGMSLMRAYKVDQLISRHLFRRR